MDNFFVEKRRGPFLQDTIVNMSALAGTWAEENTKDIFRETDTLWSELELGDTRSDRLYNFSFCDLVRDWLDVGAGRKEEEKGGKS